MKKDKRIAVVDMDDAYYLGIEGTGVYFASGEGPDGWYVSTAYDIPHDCGDMTQDDGPYPTEGEALLAGLEQAVDMLYNNEIWRGWKADYARLHRQFRTMGYPARYGRFACRVLRRDEKHAWPRTMLEIEYVTRAGIKRNTIVDARKVVEAKS
jgi:hypothetical protein